MQFFIFSWPFLRVRGPDAASWLHGIVTSNVASVRAAGPGILGASSWGLLLTKQGKIHAELHILGTNDGLSIGVSGGDSEAVFQALDGYLVMEDAELEVAGAKPVAMLVGEALAADTLDALRTAGISVHSAFDSPGLFLATAEGEDKLRQGLTETLGANEVDAEGWEQQRLRLGIPAFGIDFTSADNAHDASLERRTVDWTKGCYLGQEVVCMQDMRGKVKRRLVRVGVWGEEPLSLAAGDVLVDATGAVAGEVKTAQNGLGIAQVKAPWCEAGASLSVHGVKVQVSALHSS